MTKILQVVTDTDRRGAQVFACDLHAALERRGHRVSTVALARGSVGGLELRTLGSRRLSVGSLRALRREARQHDVVLAHGSSTLPACAISLLNSRTPFLYRQISDSLFWAPDWLRRARVRVGLRRAARVVALWSGSARTLHASFAVPDERLRVIPNGVPPERFPVRDLQESSEARVGFCLKPDRPTAVYAGALVVEKGVDVVLEALRRVPELQLVVAGDGPERDALEGLAAQCAPGRVVFVGTLDQAQSAYVAGDFVVLASRGGDSMPAALIEAGFMGIPSIATPIGAIPEIVQPGVTGALVAVGSEQEIAAAMQSMISDADRTRELGQAARAHCLEHYAIDHIALDWEAVVAEVVPRSG